MTVRPLFRRIRERISLTSRLADVAMRFFVPRNGNVFITCRGKSDGMAAQACAIYSAMLYAKATGNQYCHTALLTVDHNYEEDAHWEQKVEQYFSFSLDEHEAPHGLKTFCLDEKISILQLMLLSGIYRLRRREFLVEKQHFHEYGNRHPDDYKALAKVLRSKFYAHKTMERVQPGAGRLRIACHIRRGDVRKDIYPERFTSNQQLEHRLASLVDALTRWNISCEIKIYSQGQMSEFGSLSKYGRIELGGTAFDDFRSMVESDILMTAKSCFSYCAALLSEGLVIYEPFYHKPLSSWLDCTENYTEDNKFISRVQARYEEVLLQETVGTFD